jgi:HlyD family secretion protein
MRKIITILVILGVIAGGVYAFMWRRAQQQATSLLSYQTAPAELGQLTATIGATGVVRSRQTVFLSWKTTGTVEQVLVKVGDHVKAGDRLAELEQTSLPQNIILARAELVSAKQALEDLYTNAVAAKAQALQAISVQTKAVRNAQYQLDNYTIPSEQQGLSATEALALMQKRLDEARAAFEPYKFYPSGDATRKDLKEKLDRAQADYDAAVKRLEYEYALAVAQSNLDKALKDYAKWENGPSPDDIAAAEARIAAAQATLNQAWLEAPISGVVTLVDTLPGDQAAIGAPAFRLDDLSELLVDVSVSEVDVNQIQIGQDVVLTFDAARGREYHGLVSQVDRVGNVTQGTPEFIVTVKLTDADEQVKPGMTAAVNIVVNQLNGVLLVPNRAVRFRDGKQVVYILKDNQLMPVTIQLGASSDTASQVVDGDLQVGDLIVLNPPTVFESNGPPPFVRTR